MKRRPTTIRERIFELLADGKPHRSDEIGAKLSEAYGFSHKAITAELSFFANHRFVRRERDGKFLVYRRVDVEVAA